MEQKRSIVDILRDIPGIPPIHRHKKRLAMVYPVLLVVQILNIFYLAASIELPVWQGLSMILSVITVVCFFILSYANTRFQTAAILRILYLLCAILSEPLNYMGLLMLVSSLLSLAACFQEFYAHGEIVDMTDGALGHHWRNLFFWYLGSLMVSLISAIFLPVLMAVFEWSATVNYWVVTAATYLPEFLVQTLYLIYIWKTICYIRKEPENG